MKMAKRIGLFFASLTLIACSNRTSYNEAELIRKLDSLQQTVSQLSHQVQKLDREINQIGEQQAAVTTTALTTTTPLITSKITTRNPKITTKKSTTLATTPTSLETSTPVFVLTGFGEQVEYFKTIISSLSADIAASEVEADETKKFDQFYVFQEETRFVESEISGYRQSMKENYENKKLDQDIFMENERQLNQLMKALQAVENQLNYRFGVKE